MWLLLTNESVFQIYFSTPTRVGSFAPLKLVYDLGSSSPLVPQFVSLNNYVCAGLGLKGLKEERLIDTNKSDLHGNLPTRL